MGTELTPYLNALTQYVSCNEEIIETLKSLRRQAENVRKTSRAIQTTGTTLGAVSTVSTLGILFAPVTGGLSLGLSAVALGTAVGGVGATVIGGISDHVETKKLGEKIEEQQKKHVRSVERLNKEQDKIRKICETLNKKGYSTDVAMVSTLACLGSNTFKFAKGTKDAIDAAKVIELAIESQTVTKLLADTGIKVSTHVRAAGPSGFSIIFPSAEAAGTLSPSQVDAVMKLSNNPQLFGQGMKVFKVLAVVGVVFTVIDITMLVTNWNEPHQLDGIIQHFIEKLEGDCKCHLNNISMIKTLTNL